jgi:tRNA threonylcarbamoyladenosine modification (KEOPS) complex Cgi121 subunit
LGILIYEDVENTEEIREALLTGKIPDFALVNPEMIVSSFHLLLAASTALMQAAQDTLSVKTLHAELLYSLAPTTNISDSFRVFGAGKSDTKLLLAFIDTPREAIHQVMTLVKGRALLKEEILPSLDARPIPPARLARFRKVFKLGAAVAADEKKGNKQKGKKKKKKTEEREEGGEQQESLPSPPPPPPPSQEEEEMEEDIEHAIISRIAAKRLL